MLLTPSIILECGLPVFEKMMLKQGTKQAIHWLAGESLLSTSMRTRGFSPEFGEG
jgi:hypothetical protein